MEIIGDMGAFSARVLGEIRAAAHRVNVECVIVRDDHLGHALGAAMSEAAARGVRCRLLYDPLGCRKTKRSFFAELRRAGIEVQAYGWVGALLAQLASDPTRLFTKAELLRDIWDCRAPVRTSTGDSHAVRLRQKLARHDDRRWVSNVWGVGYRLCDLPTPTADA